jgi:hypothetical protein
MHDLDHVRFMIASVDVFCIFIQTDAAKCQRAGEDNSSHDAYACLPQIFYKYSLAIKDTFWNEVKDIVQPQMVPISHRLCP